MKKKSENKMAEIIFRALKHNLPIPEIESKQKLEEFIDSLAQTGREILKAAVDQDSEVAAIKEKYQKKLSPMKLVANTFFEAIVRYCQKHRNDLLPENRKSIELIHGTIGWQLNPPSIKLKVTEEEAIAYLKSHGHLNCIRTKESIDFEFMGKYPELARTLPIVEYKEGGEYLFLRPQGVQISFMRRMKHQTAKTTKTAKPRGSKK